MKDYRPLSLKRHFSHTRQRLPVILSSAKDLARSMIIGVLLTSQVSCKSDSGSWVDHPIYKALVDSTRDLPNDLDSTALFRNSVTQTPSEGVIPYSVKVPFWTDNAHKQRYMFIPPGTSISLDESTGLFRFPIGSVFAKHFSTGDTPDKYVETRIMVLRDNKKWEYRTYRWHKDQTTTTSKEVTRFSDASTNHEMYRIPSEEECQGCHNKSRGDVLGFKPEQMNFEISEQQHALDLLAVKIGFENLSAIKSRPAFPDPNDTVLDVDSRARSYLDVNCSYCHNSKGPAPFFDTRIALSLAETKMLEGGVVVPGQPDASLLYQSLITMDQKKRMPFTSVHVDKEGAALIKAWIEQLEVPSATE